MAESGLLDLYMRGGHLNHEAKLSGLNANWAYKSNEL